MSVGWLLGSSAKQTRQFANEHGSAAAPAPGVAGGRGEPRWAAWLGGRLARSCPAPPQGTTTLVPPGLSPAPRGHRAAPRQPWGAEPGVLLVLGHLQKMQQEKAKWKEKTGILYWPSHGSADLYSVFLEVTNSWHTGLSELSITTTHVTLKRIKWLGCFLCLLIS